MLSGPDDLMGLVQLDTGLPRKIAVRRATSEQRASEEPPTLVIRLDDEPTGSLERCALLTVLEPVRQSSGPAIAADELQLYISWIQQHRESLLRSWAEGRDVDHLRFLDGFLLTPLWPKSTGLPHIIDVRAADYGPIEPTDPRQPTLVIRLQRGGYDEKTLALLSLQEPVEQVFGPPLEPAVLAIYAAWIRLNRAALLAHWQGDTDSPEMFEALRRLPGPPASETTAERPRGRDAPP